MSILYKFDDFEVDTVGRRLTLRGDSIPLPQKPFEVLVALLERPGQVVAKQELMNLVWPNAFVEEANLTQSIFVLRKALGDRAAGGRYIVTVPGRGYQLGVVPTIASNETPPPTPEINPAEKPPANPDLATPAPINPTPANPPEGRHSWLRWAAWVGILPIAVWAMYVASGKLMRPTPFAHMTTRKLTNSGTVEVTAISPTGKYVAFVSQEANQSDSLSILDLKSGNARVILRDRGLAFANLAFSPDESLLYYRTHSKADDSLSSEHRIPFLGGDPMEVVSDIDGPLTFTDGGSRICFLREKGRDTFSFVSAAAAGGDERILATGSRPIPIASACSPDGQRAAIATEVGGIAMLDFKTGQRTPFYSTEHEIYPGLVFDADGKGLVASVVTPFNMQPSLVYLAYPGAARSAITNDSDAYLGSSLTSDGRTLVARQSDPNLEFHRYALPFFGGQQESAPIRWSSFLGWLDDETIVGSTPNGGLKFTDVQTGQEHQVQAQGSVKFLQPNGCGPTALVAVGSKADSEGINVWHMQGDGSKLTQLSTGKEDILPVCTSDGKWVFYADNSATQVPRIFRVAAEGGTPQQVATGTVWFALSHDGHKLAWFETQADKSSSLLILDLESGKRIATIPLPKEIAPRRALTFSRDDKSVFFLARETTADAAWELPLDGSAPQKRVELDGYRMGSLLSSPSGKFLGLITAKPTSDAVLLENSK